MKKLTDQQIIQTIKDTHILQKHIAVCAKIHPTNMSTRFVSGKLTKQMRENLLKYIKERKFPINYCVDLKKVTHKNNK